MKTKTRLLLLTVSAAWVLVFSKGVLHAANTAEQDVLDALLSSDPAPNGESVDALQEKVNRLQMELDALDTTTSPVETPDETPAEAPVVAPVDPVATTPTTTRVSDDENALQMTEFEARLKNLADENLILKEALEKQFQRADEAASAYQQADEARKQLKADLDRLIKDSAAETETAAALAQKTAEVETLKAQLAQAIEAQTTAAPLTAEVETLKAQLAQASEAQATVERLNADIDRLGAELTAAREANASVARLTSEVERLEAELVASREAEVTLGKALEASAQEKHEASLRPVVVNTPRDQELQGEIDQLREIDAQRKAAMDDLFKQLAVQKKAFEAREQEVATLQKSLDDTRASVAARDSDVAAREATIAERDQALAAQQAATRDAEARLGALEQRIADAAKEVEVYKSTHDGLQQELEQAKRVDEHRRRTLDETLVALAAAEQRSTALASSLEKLQGSVDEINRKAAAETEQLAARNALLEKEISRMEQEVASAQAEANALRANDAALQTQVSDREQRIAELETQVASLTSVDAMRRKAIDQIMLDTAVLEQAKTKLEQEVQRLQAAGSTAAIPRDDGLSARIIEMEAALAQLSKENGELKEALSTLPAEPQIAHVNVGDPSAAVETVSAVPDVRDSDLFKELEQINATLRDKVMEVDAERQRLARQLDEMSATQTVQTQTQGEQTQRYEAAQLALTEAQAREEEYKELLERLVPQVSTLEQQITALTEERQTLNRSLAERDSDLQALKVELERRDHRLAKAERVAAVLEKARAQVLQAGDREKLNMHYNMASVYAREGKFEAAESEYLQALRIDPADADVHYNLGILYDDEMKLPEKATLHYRRYLQLNPHGPDADRVRNWLMKLEMRTQP